MWPGTIAFGGFRLGDQVKMWGNIGKVEGRRRWWDGGEHCWGKERKRRKEIYSRIESRIERKKVIEESERKVGP